MHEGCRIKSVTNKEFTGFCRLDFPENEEYSSVLVENIVQNRSALGVSVAFLGGGRVGDFRRQ